jgi:hypothetical protein
MIIPHGGNDPGHHHPTIQDYGGQGHNEGKPWFPGNVGAKRVCQGFVQEATNAMIWYDQCQVSICLKYHLSTFLFCFTFEMSRKSVSSKQHKSGSPDLPHLILAVFPKPHIHLIHVYKSTISYFLFYYHQIE